MDEVTRLAELMHRRNEIAAEIKALTQGSADNVGIATHACSRIFDIELGGTGRHRGVDGRFRNGPLAGKTVGIQFTMAGQGFLDVNPAALPEYFIVLAEPPGLGERGGDRASRPWSIESVYLFDAPKLSDDLVKRGVRRSVETLIPEDFWEKAEVYPRGRFRKFKLSRQQIAALRLFGPRDRAEDR